MKIVSVTTVRNEGPYLLEWIAWHRLIGVTDFLFYSNDCDDGTDHLLDALADEGIVRHAANTLTEGKSVQWSGLQAAWKDDLRKSADWMIFSDVDEFPMIHAGQHRLGDLFDAVGQDFDAMTLPWRLFGFNGQIDLVDAPVTQQFTRCAPPSLFNPIAATFFKSIFRPSAFSRPGIHRPRRGNKDMPRWVNGSGRPLAPHVAHNDKRLSLVGVEQERALVDLHHYSLRSAQAFVLKSERGLPNRKDKQIDLSYWVTRNFNQVENHAAQAMSASLRKEMNALLALPKVADLHAISFDWHRKRFRQLIKNAYHYELYTQILLSENSACFPEKLARDLLLMFSQLEK